QSLACLSRPESLIGWMLSLPEVRTKPKPCRKFRNARALGSLSRRPPERWSVPVAPRAYWKGYLKLSLVSCPILLFPATSEREKISFHQLHKQTGNRIRYKKVDAETGREV